MNFRTIFTAMVIVAMMTATCFAKVWRVNNNEGVDADFTTLQEAHDGAESGDTLYVAGSVTSYGNLTLTKTLYIFGPGYFLSENPETQANLLFAKTGEIKFDKTDYSTSEGSLISGISSSSYPSMFVKVNNITVRRCYIGYSISVSASNINILQNYLNDVYVKSGSSNIIISNNICSYLSVDSSSSAIITNNVIHGNVSVFNSSLSNNIVTGIFGGSNNVFSYNIGGGTQFGTENGNQSNVDMTTVFVGEEGNSTDGQYQLKQGSPAIGAGYDGVDCGVFGGPTPYILSGLPPIPAIYFFISPAVGSSATGLSVQIKAKAHN